METTPLFEIRTDSHGDVWVICKGKREWFASEEAAFHFVMALKSDPQLLGDFLT